MNNIGSNGRKHLQSEANHLISPNSANPFQNGYLGNADFNLHRGNVRAQGIQPENIGRFPIEAQRQADYYIWDVFQYINDQVIHIDS